MILNDKDLFVSLGSHSVGFYITLAKKLLSKKADELITKFF